MPLLLIINFYINNFKNKNNIEQILFYRVFLFCSNAGRMIKMDNRMGKYIEKLRKKKGLTQKELANLLGISNTAISKWECDCNLPDISMLGPLSKVLDADIMVLLGYLNSNQNISNDSNDEKSNSKFKPIIIAICILLLVLNFILLSTTIFLKRKKPTNPTDEVKVYELISYDEHIGLKGYLIYNAESRLVLINKITYQELSRGTSTEIYTSSIQICIDVKSETIYQYIENKDDNKKYKLSDLINEIDFENEDSYNTDVNSSDIENNIDNITLKITYMTNDGNKDSLIAKLELNPVFI